ncbi:rpl28 [Symbiodinium sp. KB8]|nr:rpl28 [Symbiodinium sp. KB8]
MAAPDLLWECVKNSSSFIRKNKNVPTMTAEPGNLTGLNSFKYSGLAGKLVLGLDSKKVGKKDGLDFEPLCQRCLRAPVDSTK